MEDHRCSVKTEKITNPPFLLLLLFFLSFISFRMFTALKTKGTRSCFLNIYFFLHPFYMYSFCWLGLFMTKISGCKIRWDRTRFSLRPARLPIWTSSCARARMSISFSAWFAYFLLLFFILFLSRSSRKIFYLVLIKWNSFFEIYWRVRRGYPFPHTQRHSYDYL